jgi:chromosome segregation ATPase
MKVLMPGAVAALRQSRSVIGSLADRIRVPDEFVVAVENALGHHLQLVLTEQPSSAQEILADLSANKSGRASVAALAIQQYPDEKQLVVRRRNGAGRKERPPRKWFETGQIVHAMSVIQAEPSVENCCGHCLGRTFIAADLHGHGANPERPRGLRFCHADRRFVEPSRNLHRRLFEQGRGTARRPARFLAAKTRSPNCRPN